MDQSQTSADTSLTVVLDAFRRYGFEGTVISRDHGRVRCGNCAAELEAGALAVGGQHRLEGASDPSDALLVVGTTCPRCGARGTIVLGFGPSASERDDHILAELALSRQLPDPVADMP